MVSVSVVFLSPPSLNGSNLSPGTKKFASALPPVLAASNATGPTPVTALVAKLGVDKAKKGFCLANDPIAKPAPSPD